MAQYLTCRHSHPTHTGCYGEYSHIWREICEITNFLFCSNSNCPRTSRLNPSLCVGLQIARFKGCPKKSGTYISKELKFLNKLYSFHHSRRSKMNEGRTSSTFKLKPFIAFKNFGWTPCKYSLQKCFLRFLRLLEHFKCYFIGGTVPRCVCTN